MIRGSDNRLHAFVERGADAGKVLFPHKHKDGMFVVSPTRFERDYLRVGTVGEAISHLERGLKLRMSNKEGGMAAPRLIDPKFIYRPVVDA